MLFCGAMRGLDVEDEAVRHARKHQGFRLAQIAVLAELLAVERERDELELLAVEACASRSAEADCAAPRAPP